MASLYSLRGATNDRFGINAAERAGGDGAESARCDGDHGGVLHRRLGRQNLTDIAGSSAWFERGFVTYSNEAKSQMIGVSEATLLSHGAVSEPVVVEMAIGALRAARADYAISVSGIAGRTAAARKSRWEPSGLAWPAPADRA
ncbi:C-terminal domain of CinA type S [Klebsiella michiganensis]|uniref:C-terminal domain of CinA type S n=1 Tax=Klebsiella michiganensis TaxID=1134687 RepID=A0A7H4MTF3_9ENTR|nr:C-terminal domain of CinA type S [Klebsiella michiganensis]